jgi:hypothetical protein
MQNGQGGDGVANIEKLHEAFGAVDPVWSTQGNPSGYAHG